MPDSLRHTRPIPLRCRANASPSTSVRQRLAGFAALLPPCAGCAVAIPSRIDVGRVPTRRRAKQRLAGFAAPLPPYLVYAVNVSAGTGAYLRDRKSVVRERV